jgi:hypothetical protein
MINLRIAPTLLLFVAALLFAGGAAAKDDRVTPAIKSKETVEWETDHLVHLLQRRGFEVVPGGFQMWRIEDCPVSFEVMGSCFFNNPAAPYIMAVVPYWHNEYIDEATRGAFGPTEDDYTTSFRFDPNEAILIFGYLPPPAAYFGLQSYLFTKKGDYQTDNDTYEYLDEIGGAAVFFHSVPDNPERLIAFASLSDSNNNVVIERQSDGSFDELRYFIITPDRFMDKQIRQVLHKLSVEAKDIFTERIPANMTIGLEADADDFATGIRYSMPEDGGKEDTASYQWRHNPTMTLLRIRDTKPNRPPQRYPAWEDDSPEPRTAEPEGDLEPDLIDLLYQISVAWGQPCGELDCSDHADTFIDTQSSPFNLIGPLCDNIGMDCLGDTQDASYQFHAGYGFDDNQVYAVVGTLGTATGNATYVSLGVQNFRLRLGAVNVDGNKLVGSTYQYRETGVEDNLDKLYVYYFTRNCEGLKDLTDDFCLSVEDSDLVMPGSDTGSFVERNYMRVGTQRGPESTLIVPSRVLKLQRPAL